MKFLPAMLMLAATCAAAAERPAPLPWLAGCWKPVNGEAGSGEHWTPMVGGAMLGVGHTVRGGKLAEFEFMQIRWQEHGTLAFIAQPSGVAATIFRATTLEQHRAVFENPDHDFPQRVIYALAADGQLQARIEGKLNGKDRAIDFPMRRIDCTAYFAG